MFSYIFYLLGEFIALHTPLKLAYKLAEFFSDVRYLFSFADHRAVRDNLRQIFPEKSMGDIRRIRRQMSRNFGKYLVDFFRYKKIDAGYLKKNVRIENIEYFDHAVARGKGVIVLTAHIGNWELGGVVVAVAGYPFWVVALPHKNKMVNDFFNAQRQSKNIKVIPTGHAVRQCLGVLRSNKMVALVGDRDFSGGGIILDFFGRPSLFPEGPAALSLKTGASIVPGFMIRNPDDSFVLRIEKPIEIEPSGNKESDTRKIITSYVSIFEDYIRKYPEQWYMFRRFWKE